jgi:hypothetical protein
VRILWYVLTKGEYWESVWHERDKDSLVRIRDVGLDSGTNKVARFSRYVLGTRFWYCIGSMRLRTALSEVGECYPRLEKDIRGRIRISEVGEGYPRQDMIYRVDVDHGSLTDESGSD